MQKWRKSRFPTDYPVNLIVAQTTYRVIVVDVHEEGARLRDAPLLTKGTPAVIQFMNNRIMAKTAWQDGETMGIIFQTRLSDLSLGILRRMAGRFAA